LYIERKATWRVDNRELDKASDREERRVVKGMANGQKRIRSGCVVFTLFYANIARI
jgi:hypothetical protein